MKSTKPVENSKVVKNKDLLGYQENGHGYKENFKSQKDVPSLQNFIKYTSHNNFEVSKEK